MKGTQVEITVTGYINDGLNEGFEVEIKNFDKLKKFYTSKNKPHITMSFDRAKGGKPFRTGTLSFKHIKKFTVKGFLDFCE